ncbi:MAG: helix-turn-helix domain-containing protein [Opitutaceae bacterium]
MVIGFLVAETARRLIPTSGGTKLILAVSFGRSLVALRLKSRLVAEVGLASLQAGSALASLSSNLRLEPVDADSLPMNYAVSTPAQFRTVLRALRDSRGLSQAQLGDRIGVSQRRIAAIEAAPGRASFDQLSRIIAALGARLAIADLPANIVVTAQAKTTKTTRSEKGDW